MKCTDDDYNIMQSKRNVQHDKSANDNNNNIKGQDNNEKDDDFNRVLH